MRTRLAARGLAEKLAFELTDSGIIGLLGGGLTAAGMADMAIKGRQADASEAAARRIADSRVSAAVQAPLIGAALDEAGKLRSDAKWATLPTIGGKMALTSWAWPLIRDRWNLPEHAGLLTELV